MPAPILPAPLTRLFGREREVAAVTQLVTTARLLTLTGMGGIGKTRLALHVAAAMRDTFTGDIYFVPLAAITDPRLVLPTIARALGVTHADDLPLAEALAKHQRQDQRADIRS